MAGLRVSCCGVERDRLGEPVRPFARKRLVEPLDLSLVRGRCDVGCLVVVEFDIGEPEVVVDDRVCEVAADSRLDSSTAKTARSRLSCSQQDLAASTERLQREGRVGESLIEEPGRAA